MKKLIIALSLILICSISFGQAIIQRSGVGNTVQDARLSAQYNFFVPRYADTTAALAGNAEGIDSCGAIIFTYDVMGLWFRSCSGGKSWVMIDPSGIPSTGNSWLISGNAGLFTSPVDPQYIGTKTVQGFGIKTSDVNRLIMPAAGLTLLTAASDTTLNKPMTYNTSTKEWNYGYWFGSGGGGAVPISSLTAAAATNTISNASYTQQWAWALTGSQTALQLVNTSTTSAGSEKVFEILTNGTHASNNITTFGQNITNAHDGTGSINIGLRSQATNGGENIAAWFNRGKVRFGTAGTESGLLEVTGSTSGTITIQPQAAAGTYNFNLPTTAGTSGYLLTSAGGGASPMTWTNPSTITGVNIYNTDGTLTGDRTVDGGAFVLQFNNISDFKVINSINNIQLEAGSVNMISSGSVNIENSHTGGTPTINIKPAEGALYIDTLTNVAAQYVLHWDKATGLVSYADTTASGGSGANTALSNLTSPTAINQNLIAGTGNLEIGSQTNPFKILHLGSAWATGGQLLFNSVGVANYGKWGLSNLAGGAAMGLYSYNTAKFRFSVDEDGTFRLGGDAYIGTPGGTIRGTNGGLVGIDIAPTARLHIKAGTATASTAPIKLTTGVSLTTAEAGTLEYTTPQLFFTNGGAVRQELFQGQQARVSTQFDKTSDVTLANITGLTANVAAGKIYRFEAKLYTTSNVAGGVQFAIAGTATATAIIYEGLTTDAGLTTQGRAAALGTAVGAVTAVTAAYTVITGTITVNAAGTITCQFAQNASNGAASSVLVGSTFSIIEML